MQNLLQILLSAGLDSAVQVAFAFLTSELPGHAEAAVEPHSEQQESRFLTNGGKENICKNHFPQTSADRDQVWEW